VNQANRQQLRKTFFGIVVLVCIMVAVGYIFWVFLRNNTKSIISKSDVKGTIQRIAEPKEIEAIQKQPFIIFINEEEPYIGQVKLLQLNPISPQTVQTELLCGRVYFASGKGVCLSNHVSSLDSSVRVTLFGSDFKPSRLFMVEGILSRTRISSDGKYASFTVFVSGHSYDDVDLSTSTVLIDTTTGEILGNLEEFKTWKDGKLFQASDFNFWGVTFAKDSNRFYATLKSNNKTYLVQGDISQRQLTVLHENVECPSLSPDGTRIVFKKLTPSFTKRLTVLDLATMEETPLSEKDNIDDQAEWLDNQHILYQKADYDPPKWVSVFVVPADGNGKPEIYIPNATSPAVIR